MVASPPRLWPLTDCTANCRPVLSSEKAPKEKRKAIFRRKKGKSKIWSWAPKGCPTPRHTDWLTVSRKVTLTLTNGHVLHSIKELSRPISPVTHLYPQLHFLLYAISKHDTGGRDCFYAHEGCANRNVNQTELLGTDFLFLGAYSRKLSPRLKNTIKLQRSIWRPR
jgi:hypothetical protein